MALAVQVVSISGTAGNFGGFSTGQIVDPVNPDSRSCRSVRVRANGLG